VDTFISEYSSQQRGSMTKTSKTRTTRKRHSDDFRAEALQLAARVGIPAASAQLGVSTALLYGWRSKAELLKSRGEIDEELATENARLRRELAEKEQELAFLGKAAAYFAKGVTR